MNEEFTEILKMQADQTLDFKLIIDKNEFDIIDITIKNETTPVSKPTKRGGVYFSDTTVYKINAVINDLSVSKYLTRAMLGPNTEFQDIIIQPINKKNKHNTDFKIITNLTSSKQSSNKIELNLMVQNIVK
jgi:hypothetical protein|tara:strand:- start:3510 stop:3902 length:393 start_codon:yes stop_codon:yes gene_type:complete